MRSIIFGLLVLALSVSNAFASCSSEDATCTSMCVVSSALTKQFSGGNECINNCLNAATACEAREDQQRQMEQQRQQMQQQQQQQAQQQQAQQQQQKQQAAERLAQQERDAKEIGGKQQRVQQANEVAQRVGAEAAVQQQFDAAMEKGLQALDQKGYLSAEYQFKAALKIKPKDVDAKSGLLRAIVGSGRRPAAITYANEELLALAAQPPGGNGRSAYGQWLEVLVDHGLSNNAERSQLQRIYPFGDGDPESAAAAFLRSSPKSLFIPFVRQFGAVLPAIRADYVDRREEDAQWQNALKTPTRAAMQAYISRYPNGRYLAQARCTDCPELVVIPAGSFMMGSTDNEDEKPPHNVNIKRFAMGKHEVTQGQWKAVMGSNPSAFSDCGDTCPVEQVSWDDIQQYIQKLNAKSGWQYRLPSEAEWEYAAQAGSTGKWNFGSDEAKLGEHAWYNANSGGKTHPVAQWQANAFGLHDMHGNVREWVQDCLHVNYDGAPNDGSAWMTGCSGNNRVLRGGSWSLDPAFLRSTYRDRNTPGIRSRYVGFRLARTLFTP